MKDWTRNITVMGTLLIALAVLSACSGGIARETESPSEDVEENPLGPTVIATEGFTARVEGVIDSIDADVWMVADNTIYVDPGILGDDTYEVGDEVNIQGTLNPDNTITAVTVQLIKQGNP